MDTARASEPETYLGYRLDADHKAITQRHQIPVPLGKLGVQLASKFHSRLADLPLFIAAPELHYGYSVSQLERHPGLAAARTVRILGCGASCRAGSKTTGSR